jgi:erythromycin esterase
LSLTPVCNWVPLKAYQKSSHGIYRFSGIESTIKKDSDLKPISRIAKDANVVALGESIHTSGGYHQVNFRVIRYLVERMGYRVLAMETPRLEAQPAVDYVATGKGDAFGALGSLFTIYNSDAMKELFEWLRQYNLDHPSDPVAFFGFDIQ